MADLLGCPFCGGTAAMRYTGIFWVTCLPCLVEGPVREAEEEAVEAWNTRAALTASPAGDDPKALDAAARSSSTEAVEQKVERLREALKEARRDLVSMAQAGTDRLADYGITVDPAERTYGPSVAKIDAALAPSHPGKEEGRG